MFERFTDRARKGVVWAQEEARSFNHPYIGTEHLLLGLVREGEGVAARALDAAGLTLNKARDAVERRVGRGSQSPQGHMPFTPRAKGVLELALREALKLEHNYIGTEHVLLGLIREGQGVAAQVLMSEVDGGLERVSENVIAILGGALPAQQSRRIEAIKAGTDPFLRPSGVVRRTGSGSGWFTTDQVITRLEAIEARLSVIEQLLREQRGEEGVS